MLILLVLFLAMIVSGGCFAVCADDGDCFEADRLYPDDFSPVQNPTPTSVLNGCRGQQWYQYGRKVEGFGFKCMPTVVVPAGYSIYQPTKVPTSMPTDTVTPSSTPTKEPTWTPTPLPTLEPTITLIPATATVIIATITPIPTNTPVHTVEVIRPTPTSKPVNIVPSPTFTPTSIPIISPTVVLCMYGHTHGSGKSFWGTTGCLPLSFQQWLNTHKEYTWTTYKTQPHWVNETH